MHKTFPNERTYKSWTGAVWARAKEVGLDKDAVRDIAEQVSGRRSISSMSLSQFNAWFARVDDMYGPKKKRKKKTGPRHDPHKVIELATPAQKAKIRQFARNDLDWQDGWTEDGRDCISVSRIIEKHSKGKRHRIDQLTKSQARSVIEAMKKIYERKQEQGREQAEN